MADNLGYSGVIDIYDPQLFATITDLSQAEFYTKKTGTRQKIDGQVVANEVFKIGNITGLATETLPASNDFLFIRDVSTNLNKKITLANLAGTAVTTYSLLSNRVHVTGTAGITAALAGGVLTITIPQGGILTGGSFDFTSADSGYSPSVIIQDAIKVRIDNSANSTVTLKAYPVMIFVKTAGTIDSNNPARIDNTVLLDGGTDEHANGITSFYFKEISSNASAGGIITF